MIVDTHVHLGGFPALESIEDELRTRADVASWRSRFPGVYEQARLEPPADNSDALLAAMDQHGVDVSLVQPTVRIPNDMVMAMAKRHPGRMVPLAWVTEFAWDGRWPASRDESIRRERCEEFGRLAHDLVTVQGFRGIGETCASDVTAEVNPVLAADDFAPLMETLSATTTPIQFPTGWTQFPGNLSYQDPLWIDEIAGRHPGVPIILTKMGRGFQRFFDSCMAVAMRNSNVYFDMVATSPVHLAHAVDVLGPERVLFGTDWTYTWRYMTSPSTVHASALGLLDDAGLTDAGVRAALLGGNAERLYQLA